MLDVFCLGHYSPAFGANTFKLAKRFICINMIVIHMSKIQIVLLKQNQLLFLSRSVAVMLNIFTSFFFFIWFRSLFSMIQEQFKQLAVSQKGLKIFSILFRFLLDRFTSFFFYMIQNIIFYGLDKQTDSQTDSQTDRHPDRHTDSQTDRHNFSQFFLFKFLSSLFNCKAMIITAQLKRGL